MKLRNKNMNYKYSKLEKKMENVKKNYDFIFEGINDGIWDLDVQKKICVVSNKEKECYKLNHTNFSIESMYSFMHPEDVEKFKDTLNRFLISGEKRYENIYRLKSSTGDYNWILSKGLAKFNIKGEVVRIVGSHTNITEKIEMEQKLYNLAYYDTLTKLGNKENLERNFNELIKNKEKLKNIAFLNIDVDDFSLINNTLGYECGNELIKKIATYLKERYEEQHCLARLNADEFLILYTYEGNINHVEKEIENLLLEIKNQKFLINQEITISLSVGISLYRIHSNYFYDLLKYSNIALDYSKKNGKNRFELYDCKIENSIYNTLDLVNQIRIGLEKNEFYMHYQPIVNAYNGFIVGMEALVRWNHPKRGHISPIKFITAAENSGQIIELERKIINSVFKETSSWNKNKAENLFISINLSAKGLINKTLISYLRELIINYEVNPEKIEFEITETALLKNLEDSLKILKQLKEIGFKISLDDFGTGYSSLNYLKLLPISKIKLDKSFIDNIDNIRDQKLVKAIIDLSHKMELKVVGEGVETQLQQDFLNDFGCDYIQGYYYSKPQSIDEITFWIEENYKKDIL